MSITEDLYKEIILEHSQNPSHNSPLSNPMVKESGVNRSCGDEVELELSIEEGRIKDIAVLGHGCSISLASGSLMADAVENMTLEDALGLIQKFKSMFTTSDIEFPAELEDLEALSGVKKYPIRVKCATLSWNTLEQAIQTFQSEDTNKSLTQ